MLLFDIGYAWLFLQFLLTSARPCRPCWCLRPGCLDRADSHRCLHQWTRHIDVAVVAPNAPMLALTSFVICTSGSGFDLRALWIVIGNDAIHRRHFRWHPLGFIVRCHHVRFHFHLINSHHDMSSVFMTSLENFRQIGTKGPIPFTNIKMRLNLV